MYETFSQSQRKQAKTKKRSSPQIRCLNVSFPRQEWITVLRQDLILWCADQNCMIIHLCHTKSDYVWPCVIPFNMSHHTHDNVFDCVSSTCMIIQSPSYMYDHTMLVGGWLVVFYVPSTASSFRDGTPIYCRLRKTWSSVFTPFPPGIEPFAVVWQSITLLLRHASSYNVGPYVIGFTQTHHSMHH